MLKRALSYTTAALTLSIGLGLGLAYAVDPVVAPAQEQIYGSQLMTPQERAAHRAKLRAAKTAEEKARIRAELHEHMQARANQQGVQLPDTPPVAGGGMGPGASGGMGMRPGGGGRNR